MANNHLHKNKTFNIHDTNRYQTDDYAINIAIQENVDKYSIGIYITNYKVGISGYQEYWHYGLDEEDVAKTTYSKLEQAIKEITADFEYNNLPMSLLKPVVRRALDGIDVGHKERSGVIMYNYYTTDVEKEPDWRLSLYGHRYPGHELEKMNLPWNVEDPPKAIEVGDYSTTRDRVVKYKYSSNQRQYKCASSGQPKYSSSQYRLAQWNYVTEMLQDRFPGLSAAAIASFLTMLPAEKLSAQEFGHMLDQNPQAVREAIPEMPPDFMYEQEDVHCASRSTNFLLGLSPALIGAFMLWATHTKNIPSEQLTQQLQENPQQLAPLVQEFQEFNQSEYEGYIQETAQEIQIDTRNFEGLDEDFSPKVKSVLRALHAKGWQPRVAEGFRTIEQQQEKIDAGHSSLKDPNNSKHVQGLAADIIDQRWGWGGEASDTNHQFWQDLGEAARAEGLTWGGDWKSFKDVAHVEADNNNTKDMRIREKHPPNMQDLIPSFKSPQTDFWKDKKVVENTV